MAQTIVVILVVLAAALYLLRSLLRTLRRGGNCNSRGACSSCASCPMAADCPSQGSPEGCPDEPPDRRDSAPERDQ